MKLNSSEFDEQPFENVLFVSEQIEIENVERQKELLKSAAFNIWLQGTIKGNFNDFCEKLGLVVQKNKKLSEKQKEKLRQKADEIADKIMRAQKKGKYSEKVI